MKHHSASRTHLLLSFASCGLFSGAAAAVSELSVDGGGFQSAEPPITVIQEQRSNSISIVEDAVVSDSAVMQTGDYNRAAIIQYGNDKLAILRQPGHFNRAMLVQVASTDLDFQTVDSRQGGVGATNYLFQLQTSVDDPDPVAQQFGLLTFAQAKTVAQNFVDAPEVSRVGAGMLEDITLHFTSILQDRLDRGRFLDCADGSPAVAADCAATPFFATLSYGHADRDSSLGAQGYEQDIRSATLGADLRLNPRTRVGLALNLVDADGDIRHGLGNLDASGYQIGAFGSFTQSRYYLDLMATAGWIDFSGDRFGGPMKVRSDTDGWSYAARLQTGYFFGDDGLRFGPLLASGYSNGTVDSYWEKGNMLLRQWIDDQDRERFVASLGVALDRHDLVGGRQLHTYLKAELERDFGIGREDQVESRFAFAPNAILYTPVDDIGEDTYGKLSGGVSLAIGKQTKVSLAGSTLIGSDKLDTYDVYGELAVAF